MGPSDVPRGPQTLAEDDHCDAMISHGFYGIEDKVVRAIGNWIKANNPR